jgi:hypothetical protein
LSHCTNPQKNFSKTNKSRPHKMPLSDLAPAAFCPSQDTILLPAMLLPHGGALGAPQACLPFRVFTCVVLCLEHVLPKLSWPANIILHRCELKYGLSERVPSTL